MTEPKWTPGPWFFHRDELMHERHPMGSYDLIGILGSDDTGNPWDVDEANRRLIAAAPDLYEVANRARDLIAGDLMGSEWKRACREFIKDADEAIAKARGERQ